MNLFQNLSKIGLAVNLTHGCKTLFNIFQGNIPWKFIMAAVVCFLLSCLWRKKLVRKNIHNIPLPRTCHQVLTEADIRGRNVFVIGDVHGCLDELNELMNVALAEDPNVIFIFVGDLVNRGPDSVGVVRKLRNMAPGSTYAVRGNHDESALREVKHMRENVDYVDTLTEKYTWISNLDEKDIEYFSELPYTIEIPSLNAIVVHAGLIPGLPLELQDLNNMTNMRNIVNKGEPFEGGGLIATNKHEFGEPWVKFWPGPTHVYFGHDARRKLQINEYATGLDTGCCHGGELTGVFIGANGPTKFLSVKSRQPKVHG